jgi:hypothetical protein
VSITLFEDLPLISSTLILLGPYTRLPFSSFTFASKLKEKPFNLNTRLSQLSYYAESILYSTGSNRDPEGPFILREKSLRL